MRNQGVQVSYFKARGGKELALNTMMGDSVENFRKLPSFLKMIEKVNVGSFTDLEVDEENRFKYMFLAYGACIMGYKFMRKVVCIDGTFLKGKYDCVLLVATEQDGNHHQFLIAWGVVDKESSESWSWFLSRLKIIVEDDDELVIISDRHQGIINAVASLYNRAYHVFCMWHMSQNIKELRERFPEVAKYLEGRTSPERWSRAKQTGKRYSIMTTNGVESINGTAKNHINLEKKYEVIEATEGKYCVYGSTSNELVDLQSKACTCHKFDIDRIPCSHAISAAYNANISVYDFCTDYYTTHYWLEAYTDHVYPVPGEWTVQEEILVLPPLVIPRRVRKK
ncbi:protein FAR1-RELATED SEQUENCE 6-like [Henckelia pumila]|uniref:protein FAR1-RELATED SEQUENCE 6-like n=1 Tax=Henckelia pumila TaxID=405737 RepID=UPI003C6DFD8B